jgi:hypothetical protein
MQDEADSEERVTRVALAHEPYRSQEREREYRGKGEYATDHVSILPRAPEIRDEYPGAVGGGCLLLLPGGADKMG